MWHIGTLSSPNTNGLYKYYAKVCDEPNEYGIGGWSRVIKLNIKKNGAEIYSYERRLDFDNLDDEGKTVLAIILEKFS